METNINPETATPATAPVATHAAPRRLEGNIDPHVLNAHLLAASKDETRKTMKGINFRVKDGALHIASCDGRILMHTEILERDFWNGPDDFDVIIEARKIPCTARDLLCKFTIEGDRFEINTSKGTCIIPVLTDEKYPLYEQVEIDWANGVYPEHWVLFDPKNLEYVRQYIGEKEYLNSDCLRTASTVDETGKISARYGAAHAWRKEGGAFRQTVTLMPLRLR